MELVPHLVSKEVEVATGYDDLLKKLVLQPLFIVVKLLCDRLVRLVLSDHQVEEVNARVSCKEQVASVHPNSCLNLLNLRLSFVWIIFEIANQQLLFFLCDELVHRNRKLVKSGGNGLVLARFITNEKVVELLWLALFLKYEVAASYVPGL